MKKKTLFIALILVGGFMLAYGCNDDEGNGTTDADADAPPDYVDIVSDPDADPDVTPEVTPDADAVGDPDIDITVDVEPDGACAPLHGGVCNLIDNCGCTAGQQCVMDINPTDPCDLVEICSPSAGTLPTGSECTPSPTESCAPGNACLTSGGESKCYHWCDDLSDCTDGAECNVGPITYGMPEGCDDVTLLYKACDPGCPEDSLCDPWEGTGCEGELDACIFSPTCEITQCVASGETEVGGDCAETNTCVIGSGCYSSDGGVTASCMVFCDSAHTCDTGTCSPWTYTGAADNPYVADGFGVCVSE